jgi:hypothetical protein
MAPSRCIGEVGGEAWHSFHMQWSRGALSVSTQAGLLLHCFGCGFGTAYHVVGIDLNALQRPRCLCAWLAARPAPPSVSLSRTAPAAAASRAATPRRLPPAAPPARPPTLVRRRPPRCRCRTRTANPPAAAAPRRATAAARGPRPPRRRRARRRRRRGRRRGDRARGGAR